MHNNNEVIIPILTAGAAYFLSGEAARLAAPFIGVFLAGIAGAAYYIGRQKKMGPIRALGVFWLLMGAAMTVTLPLIELMQLGLNQTGVQLPKSAGMPLAFLITAFPKHIMDILRKQKEKWYGKSAELD